MPPLEQTADLGIFYQVDMHSDPWTNPETITQGYWQFTYSTTRFQSPISILFYIIKVDLIKASSLTNLHSQSNILQIIQQLPGHHQHTW